MQKTGCPGPGHAVRLKEDSASSDAKGRWEGM
jgi:hypothetical protein